MHLVKAEQVWECMQLDAPSGSDQHVLTRDIQNVLPFSKLTINL
jgi:hypothetical protein